MSKEECVRCGDIDNDRRTLWMACLYALEELKLPFKQVDIQVEGEGTQGRHFYTLLVCKQCRADWMAAIEAWFWAPIQREPTEGGFYVRKFGVSQIKIEDEEME